MVGKKVKVVSHPEIYRHVEKLEKPVLVFVGHMGVEYTSHPALHNIFNRRGEEDHVALKRLVDKVLDVVAGRASVLDYGELPHFAVALKLARVGDLHKAIDRLYFFPNRGDVLERFKEMWKEDESLDFAIRYYLKYREGTSPDVFRVIRAPRTRIAAAVSYILHSLALATAEAAGLKESYVRNYHERKRERAKEVLWKPPQTGEW